MSSERTEPRGATDDLALFHRTLAELCRSEVPLPRAFRVLEKDLERGKLRHAVAGMAADVEAGEPLNEAYARRRDVFPSTYRALVEAGTASGDLPGTLDEIARDAARRAETEIRIRRALAWPMVSAVVVLLVGAAALAFALPRLWGYAKEVSGTTPAPIAFGALGVLVAFLGVLFFLAWRRRPTETSWSFAWPVLGPIRRDAVRSTVASTLALLVRRRLPLPQVFELAAATAGHPAVADDLRASAERAREGAGLADSLEAAGLFDASVIWLVRGAEAAGDPETALGDAAYLHRRRLDRRLDRFTLLVKPAAELVLGAVVFAFAFSYLVPLYRYSLFTLWGN